jgi:hypothetical protein
VNVVCLHEFRMTPERLPDVQEGAADLLDGVRYWASIWASWPGGRVAPHGAQADDLGVRKLGSKQGERCDGRIRQRRVVLADIVAAAGDDDHVRMEGCGSACNPGEIVVTVLRASNGEKSCSVAGQVREAPALVRRDQRRPGLRGR